MAAGRSAMSDFPSQDILAKALLNPAVFGPDITRIETIETHISYIFLAGDYAYKIKKAVELGFLNFSTLDLRHFYCQEELRLNRRYAPALYLEVLPITGTYSNPVLNGGGVPIEWAVKMQRFAERDRLDHMLANDLLTPQHIDMLAQNIAGFHFAADITTLESFGSLAAIAEPALANFAPLRTALPSAGDQSDLDKLQAWTEQRLEDLQATFAARKINGFVRECHGDLHLGNIALVDDAITLFDCLEFSAELRWIDTISEVAFLLMDIQHKGRGDLGRRFLNGYLEASGDYAGLSVLDFYCVYRALVRAKVASLRARQEGIDAAQKAALAAEARSYIRAAQQFTTHPAPALIITHGVSGSGKTWGTQDLLERIGALRLRSDVERKRLQGLTALARTDAGIAQAEYKPEATARTYSRLLNLGAAVMGAGYTVIVDATFLQRAQRDEFRHQAQRAGVRFYILHFFSDEATLRRRIATRLELHNDASEADGAVLDYQLATQEPLGADELAEVVNCGSAQLMRLQRSEARSF